MALTSIRHSVFRRSAAITPERVRLCRPTAAVLEAPVKTRKSNFVLPEVSLDPNRPNRLLIALSDVHWTDATVGVQNLHAEGIWEEFFLGVRALCEKYEIKEVKLEIVGDGPDLIRSGIWAKRGVYPWERHRTAEIKAAVDEITAGIIKANRDVFDFIKNLETFLQQDGSHVEKVEKIFILGNHDKELMLSQGALKSFYDAVGVDWRNYSDDYRRLIGKMYGNEAAFVDPDRAPWFPFYYGDRSFQTFATHGQPFDADNSRQIKADLTHPGWSTKDGWREDLWRKQRLAPFWEEHLGLCFAPFLAPCFGDSVAAGVLSTFIYRAKSKLGEAKIESPRLNQVLDELDLYRPTYVAPGRILVEARKLKGTADQSVKIVEETLYDCVMQWLEWDFTHETSPPLRSFGLTAAKWTLKFLHLSPWGGLHLRGIEGLMKMLAGRQAKNAYQRAELTKAEMQRMPPFLAENLPDGFHLHLQGHTHRPVEGEPSLQRGQNHTYINLGCSRDQMVQKEDRGFRRRSVFRAVMVHDFKAPAALQAQGIPRSLTYQVSDEMGWGDDKDRFGIPVKPADSPLKPVA